MKNLVKCSVCGYVHEGDAPQACPKCGAPADKFLALSEEDAEKIYRSDYTNSLHMELIALADQIIDISLEGIEDNLDPNCLSVFEKAKNTAWTMKQMSKAELAGHMSKGKW